MSLSAAKKRDILICCIVALLILCAMAARILGSPEGAPGLGPMIRNGIYMADGGMGRVGAEAHNSGPDPAVPYSYRPADAALAHGAGYQI